MKNYERPVVLATEDLAEGVYAASGAVSTDCWVIDYVNATDNFVDSDMSRGFRVNAHHASIQAGHIPDCVWVFEFNQPITAASSDSGYVAAVEGNVVKIASSNFYNMNENENWGFAMRASSENYKTLEVVNSYIYCVV